MTDPYIPLGALHLLQAQTVLPLKEKYLRCVEQHDIENNKLFELIICMSHAMSTQLMSAVHISIDTSFKRVHGKWQEFEIETWDPIHMKSIVAARAFTTSQSSSEHLILFTRIFEIATEDTGQPVQFHHIHGAGFQTWIADAHKGQALGLDTISLPCNCNMY
ncbi:hypothetical protein HYPSUDRAFT_1092632 [Hypholoma sublateritium FD-334 SS-4]|uniref:Uncharacterized protein n=1 Tax=Hypholoma sublateritium (strain FD-334 SS-4) TaxID=945553 RepID=A0A0D2NV11_HYPSF|nr:hypothetical protein HYPSUDRAFT_1092632 [Hypholoma sublateritium FD-334 SS-4]